MTVDEDNWPIAIDPPGCGCTECLTGQYVPFEQASPEQIVDMLLGKLRNNLNTWDNERMELRVTVVVGEHLRDLPPEQSARLLKKRVLTKEA